MDKIQSISLKKRSRITGSNPASKLLLHCTYLNIVILPLTISPSETFKRSIK